MNSDDFVPSEQVQVVHDVCVEIASQRQIVSYAELLTLLKRKTHGMFDTFDIKHAVYRTLISSLLVGASNLSMKTHGVLVSSVVVRIDTGMPGHGFFKMYNEFRGTPVDSDALRMEAFASELVKVYDQYGIG